MRAIRALVARLRGFPETCEDCGEPTYRGGRAVLCLLCKAKRREASNLRYRLSGRGRERQAANNKRWQRENPERTREKARRWWRKNRRAINRRQREQRREEKAAESFRGGS